MEKASLSERLEEGKEFKVETMKEKEPEGKAEREREWGDGWKWQEGKWREESR